MNHGVIKLVILIKTSCINKEKIDGMIIKKK